MDRQQKLELIQILDLLPNNLQTLEQGPYYAFFKENLNGGSMTWLGLAVGMAVLMVVWRMRRPPDEKMDPPGNFTMFFSPTQGEGDLFIGGIVVIYFISRFFLESFQNIRVTFG